MTARLPCWRACAAKIVVTTFCGHGMSPDCNPIDSPSFAGALSARSARATRARGVRGRVTFAWVPRRHLRVCVHPVPALPRSRVLALLQGHGH